ncbi:hypothetical protein KR038_003326 [Drosophila bunnanda]|nr:hypothetical protein KR038_003326 [Drosophila bunnanda]
MQSRWRMERDQRLNRQHRPLSRGNSPPVPSIKSPERIPFKNPYAPRTSARFSPHFHPQNSSHSNTSDTCIGVLPVNTQETESEKSVEPVESEFSGLSFSGYKIPSLGNLTDSSSGKTYVIDYGMPRIRGGAVNTNLQQTEEPRLKINSSSRINFRPSCGNAPPEARVKRRSSFKWKTYWRKPQTGEEPHVETLLSPRSLIYSHCGRSEQRDKEQSADDVREYDRYSQSSSARTRPEPELDISLLDLPEVPSSSSEEKPVLRCSRGLLLPSLGSSHSFLNIWRRKDLQSCCSGSPILPAGGLYGQVKNLKFNPIDRLDSGFSLTPLFEGSPSETRERIRYFASEFDRLSIRKRVRDIELRFHQLRTLQEKSNEAFFKHFREQPVPDWPMPPKGTLYICPTGGRCCPPVTNETILGHKLTYHLNEAGLELREIFVGDRLLVIFNPRAYIMGRNTCMSAMVYGGIYEDPSTLPGRRFMPSRNKQLPSEYAGYTHHLPMFVMVCRNRRRDIDGPQVGQNQCSGCCSGRDDVLTIWVVSVDLPQPVHVMLTVMNRRMDATRSCVLQVRPLYRTQDCLKIVESSSQYMRLGEQDLRVLTSDDTEPLYMEITVKEFAVTLTRTGSGN